MKAIRPVFEELASRKSCKDLFCPRNLLFMMHLAACIDFAFFEKYFSFLFAQFCYDFLSWQQRLDKYFSLIIS